MKSKLFLTVLLLAAISTIGISQDKQSQPAEIDKAAIAELERTYKLRVDARSLIGVKSIYVLVEGLKEDAKSAGLTEEQLKTDIELKLQLAGIKVNSREESLASKDGAHIYVNINTFGDKGSPFIMYHASLVFTQRVTVLRSPFTTVFGTTWSKGAVGIRSRSKFPETAQQAVKELVDIFLNNYLTANPKK